MAESTGKNQSVMEEDKRPDPSELKIEINELCWRRLPSGISLYQAELESLKIFEQIMESWDLWEAAQ